MKIRNFTNFLASFSADILIGAISTGASGLVLAPLLDLPTDLVVVLGIFYGAFAGALIVAERSID